MNNLIISFSLIMFFFVTDVKTIKHEVTDQVYFKIAIGEQYEDEIVIGLFGNVVPKTVKNFKVITTNGINGKSYNGTYFHRVIKRFMIQGGDILYNNGSGSISIYGKYFDDENFNINHTASGYVSMANLGPNTNGCQFFITTIATPWLDSRHTIFGKVIKGQSLVHKIEQIKSDVNDYPLIPIKILESGLVETKSSFLIDDRITYNLFDWIKAGFVPLSFSFATLGFFHWVIKKLN